MCIFVYTKIMNKEKIEKFFELRPAVTKQGFCKEVGISRGMLTFILKDERKISVELANKIKTVMKTYGVD